MEDQFKKMLEELSEIRKKHQQDPTNKNNPFPIKKPTIYTSVVNMDFSSLYPTMMTYLGVKKSMRIIKGKKILKNIKERK